MSTTDPAGWCLDDYRSISNISTETVTLDNGTTKTTQVITYRQKQHTVTISELIAGGVTPTSEVGTTASSVSATTFPGGGGSAITISCPGANYLYDSAVFECTQDGPSVQDYYTGLYRRTQVWYCAELPEIVRIDTLVQPSDA